MPDDVDTSTEDSTEALAATPTPASAPQAAIPVADLSGALVTERQAGAKQRLGQGARR